MTRYLVKIASPDRAQLYSSHRKEDAAVARMDELIQAPWVTRAWVVECDGAEATVIARVERDDAAIAPSNRTPGGRVTRWRRTWKT